MSTPAQQAGPDVVQAMGQTSLGCYATAVYKKFQMARHLDIITQALEAVETGGIKRLMIFAPPRHGKSVLTSQIFPAWYHGKHPDHMLMQCCHTQQLATQFGRYIRNHLLSPAHQYIFPDYEMSQDSQAKHEWKTSAGGEFFAAGVSGGITGRGCHLGVIDDPIKSAEEANSEVMREHLHNWYAADFYTRLEPDAAIVLIQTRWHELDLAGWLLNDDYQEEIDDWQILSLPAIAERDEGWREIGQPLWPERYTIKHLKRIEMQLTDYQWTSLYQQRPSAQEGRLIKRDWWQYYDWNPHMAASREIDRMMVAPYQIIISVDTAMEEGEENDWTVIQVWLSTDSGEYLLEQWRERAIAPEVEDKIIELAIYWRANAILIEKKASGHSIIQHCRLRTKLPIIGVKPKGSKLIRAQATSPYIRSKRCFLYRHAPYLKTFLDEHSSFPTAPHDDQVDTSSQYLAYIHELYGQQDMWGDQDTPNEERLIYDA